MYRESFTLPCSIIRGGTSKGIYFLESSLPPAGELRDKILLAVFGSPDIRQIDGLGGANSLTSKVCIPLCVRTPMWTTPSVRSA